MSASRLPMWCSRCGCAHVGRCPNAPKQKKDNKSRAINEPHRKNYGKTDYRSERQDALERTGGKCAFCGVRIAKKIGGSWKMLDGGGGTHHEVKLRDSQKSRLIPACRKCHKREDDRLERANRGKG